VLFRSLNAEKVSKEYSGHKALNEVSIKVPAQSIFGLLGPNGAGKTTLIRIINQIIAPDSGEVTINNERLHAGHTATIGYLPEERGLYRKMKVGEQAMYLAMLKGLKQQEARSRLKYWFEKFDILPWWNKKVEELSKGMQQKIQFIVTVVHQPSLLVFDEPFSGFDPINVNLLKDEILQLRKTGATIIFSTHNMASVEELCDYIALINNSQTILEGSVPEIKKQFWTNSFEVALREIDGKTEDFLPAAINPVLTGKADGITTYRFTLKPGESPNSLIASLLPNAEIVAFKEVLPSMNDIFISKVTENKQ